MNYLVLTQRESHVLVAPQGPVDSGSQDQFAADQFLFRYWNPGNRCGLDQPLETPDENPDAARLVHEVGRSPLQGEHFPVSQRMTGQKDDRQVAAPLAQLRQKVDAGGRWQAPIKQDKIGVGEDVERREQRVAIGEPVDRKAAFFQLPAERLPETVVVLSEKDAYGAIPPLKGQRLLRVPTVALLHVSFFPVSLAEKNSPRPTPDLSISCDNAGRLIKLRDPAGLSLAEHQRQRGGRRLPARQVVFVRPWPQP